MAGGCVRAECHQWAVSACLNRNDMLTSAVPIYFGTDEDRFVSMQGGRAFTLPPRRDSPKGKKEKQTTTSVSEAGPPGPRAR